MLVVSSKSHTFKATIPNPLLDQVIDQENKMKCMEEIATNHRLFLIKNLADDIW